MVVDVNGDDDDEKERVASSTGAAGPLVLQMALVALADDNDTVIMDDAIMIQVVLPSNQVRSPRKMIDVITFGNEGVIGEVEDRVRKSRREHVIFGREHVDCEITRVQATAHIRRDEKVEDHPSDKGGRHLGRRTLMGDMGDRGPQPLGIILPDIHVIQ